MGKPRTPNQKKAYAALKGRLNQYSYLVQTVYDTLNAEAAKLALSTGYAGEREFRWSDYPQTKKRIDALQGRFCNDITGVIYAGTEKEWMESNIVQDMLAAKAMKSYHVESKGKKYQKLYNQTNQDALKAFQERVDGGMNLSSNVWNQSVAYRRELECAISAGVEKGMSAVTLSKRLSQYLTDFDQLKADYKEKYGKAVDCLNCEYRSMRLARTEINMAYRTAEQKRWQQFDFVLGYEIKLSGSHPVEDICDSLQGRYPKEFRFTGWHPNCMCYCVPILKTEEQFWADDNETIENEVTDYPDSMKSWLSDNADRVLEAQKRDTLPYWLKDNESLVNMAKQSTGEFVMTEDIRNELLTRGFYERRTIAVDRYVESAMSGFNVLKFDKAFEAICDENECRLNIKMLRSVGRGEIELLYSGVNPKGENIKLERAFRFEEHEGRKIRVVEHELFRLPDSMQGKGISKRVFRDLFTQYEACGIERVYIHANINVGGYCWAKYGCLAKDASIKSVVEEKLAEGKITLEESKDALSFLDKFAKEGRVPMQGLANKAYGKRLLMESDWDGIIDLNDAVQMDYLYKYIGM